MAYKWKPSKSQRREFAEKMNNDADFAASYYQRKEDRAVKRRAGSQFNYSSAGGNYVPTKIQYDFAFKFLAELELTNEQKDACNIVISAFSMNDRTHHDYIHIVNELIRSNA